MKVISRNQIYWSSIQTRLYKANKRVLNVTNSQLEDGNELLSIGNTTVIPEDKTITRTTNSFVTIVFQVFFLHLFLPFGLTAQTQVIRTSGFYGQTIDVIHWDNVEYMSSQSPLSHFDGYKDIFGSLKTDTYIPEAPFELDKNYQAKWFIKDSVLYLHDIEILEGADRYPDRYKNIESLTRRNFKEPSGDLKKYCDRYIAAQWFTGFIFVKRQPDPHETYCDCMYRLESFKVLFFINGYLKYWMDNAQACNYYINNNETENNPQKYEKNLKNSDGIFFKVNPCIGILEEQLSLDEEHKLYHFFTSFSTDEIRWNDSAFMVSESPLSFFEKYKDVYPYVWPIESGYYSEEKNYITRLTIVDEKLYIYDIGFDLETTGYLDEKQENTRIEYLNRVRPNRLKAIERLTGKKFRQVPALKQKAIFAEWYSGTLYFKRPPAQNEYPSLTANYFLVQKYNCEPFYKITVEKGIMKSMEKTTYMVIKRNFAYGHN